MNQSISNNIHTETEELKTFFRQGILQNNADMINQPELLEQQVGFLVDRANNYGNDPMSESEISDMAYKLGLTDNNLVNRTVSNKYDFCKQ